MNSLHVAVKMTVGAVDEEMIVGQEVAIVEEAETIVVDLLIDTIVVEVIDTIVETVAIDMIETREGVAGKSLLLQWGTEVHRLLVMLVVVALVPDRLEVVEEDTGPEAHKEEAMMIATRVDMMITGTMVVVVGALKATGVGEALTEGMVALRVF